MFALSKRLGGFSLGVFACSLLLIVSFTSVNAQSLQQVRWVVDGDTIILRGGEKVRLLGINTPELEHNGRVAEQGALPAKQYLQKMLAQHQVYLEYDVEKVDHYGRSLAYVFLDNGLHVNSELLKSGMATLSIHPPNIKYSHTLSMAQKYARSRETGVWSQASHQLNPATVQVVSKLKHRWGRFKGRVQSIQYTKKGAKLYLSKQCYMWIPASNYRYFTALEKYLNQKVDVRAWSKKWGREWSMQVIHPSQIILPSS